MESRASINASCSCAALAFFLWEGYFTLIQQYLSSLELFLLSMTCKGLRVLIRSAYPWILRPRDGASMIQHTLKFIGNFKDFRIPMLLSMSRTRGNYTKRRIYRFGIPLSATHNTYLPSFLESFAKKLEDFIFVGLSGFSIDRVSWESLENLGIKELFMRDCVFRSEYLQLPFERLLSLKVLYYMPTSAEPPELCLPDNLEELYLDLSHLSNWATITIMMKSCICLEKV